MSHELFKRTNGFNPPSRLKDTESDPFRFAAVSLTIFGVHIGDTNLQGVSMLGKIRHTASSVATVLMVWIFFVQHATAYMHGLSGWVYVKWLAAAVTAVLTATVVMIRGTKIKHVAGFYRTNFLPWKSKQKTITRVTSTATILTVWAFVLVYCIDFALNHIREDQKIFIYFLSPTVNESFVRNWDPMAEGFLRVDAVLRWFFILGPTCFAIFLYTFMTQLATGNMQHLTQYINTLKHADHDDPPEVVRQVRDLYFHQASSAHELDHIFSGLVLLWYLMCTVFTFANIRGAMLGEFPPGPFGRSVLTFLFELFPLYCVYYGITMAGAGFHDATLEVLTQYEALMAMLGKRYQLQHTSYFLAHMCVSSMGLNPPKLTVCRLFTIKRLLLAVLILFFMFFVLLSARIQGT
ncbi:uncharacterized protein LOC135370553 [Ornithodoros turicata]|uniref:uncharacterized protein LOC135370553 n=1 Tax=Ornithodoros turicata TaxID=34597 RepID=UPI00313A347E